MKIDIGFDFRSDSDGKDPDFASKTLRQYHRLLWSKSLPSGDKVELQHVSSAYHYLIFESKSGTMFLSSDSITTSMSAHKRLKPLLSEIPQGQINRFKSLGSTIGARILFPGKKVDGLQTINQARGFAGQIKDRFDLTLECIRLFYLDEPSPLRDVLGRYSEFFELFGEFRGYVDFFLLQDLVEDSTVKFFLPFESFEKTGPYPKNVEDYLDYMNNSSEFLVSRNDRIGKWATSQTR